MLGSYTKSEFLIVGQGYYKWYQSGFSLDRMWFEEAETSWWACEPQVEEGYMNELRSHLNEGDPEDMQLWLRNT